MGFNRANPNLFYSRRIGREPQGAAPGEYVDLPPATTVLGAAKVTGQTQRRVDGELHRRRHAARVRRHGDRRRARPRRGRAADQLPGDARAPRRRPARRLRRAHHAREPEPERPGAERPAAGQRTRRRRRWPPVSARASATTSSPAASRAAAWLGRTSSMLRLQRSSARYFQRPGRDAICPTTRRPRRSRAGACRATSTGTAGASGPTRRSGR